MKDFKNDVFSLVRAGKVVITSHALLRVNQRLGIDLKTEAELLDFLIYLGLVHDSGLIPGIPWEPQGRGSKSLAKHNIEVGSYPLGISFVFQPDIVAEADRCVLKTVLVQGKLNKSIISQCFSHVLGSRKVLSDKDIQDAQESHYRGRCDRGLEKIQKGLETVRKAAVNFNNVPKNIRSGYDTTVIKLELERVLKELKRIVG